MLCNEMDENHIRKLEKGHLARKVKRYMAQGWQPFGSPFLDSRGELFQAMVSYNHLSELEEISQLATNVLLIAVNADLEKSIIENAEKLKDKLDRLIEEVEHGA